MFQRASWMLSYTLTALLCGGLVTAQAQDQPGNSATAQPADQQAVPKRVRVSQGVISGLLIRKVNPAYPKKARKKHIQGVVTLAAKISKDGDIVDLSVVSGDPILAEAAVEAVKQWKYKPYFFQGESVEVDTQITVNFTLADG